MGKRDFARIVALSGLLLWGISEMRAQGNFGFGFVLGEPTGLAWKYKMDHTHAIAGALGILPGEHVRLNVDVLWHTYVRDSPSLAVHYGPGILVGVGHRRVYRFSDGSYGVSDDGGTVGFRMVVGLTYTIPRSPVDLFFEAAPALLLASPSGMAVDFGLGARVYP
jgi:hypothetical protein